jgi:branched-subunit amino acid aminotransferase/4-amino-4-deoxychorismate lyase
VLEGVTSNVFVVQGDVLVTPCVGECLPGITRSRLLELSREAGIAVYEQVLLVDALDRADEVFVTNAVQGMRAVSSIEGKIIERSCGEGLFATLCELYRQDRRAVVGAIR